MTNTVGDQAETIPVEIAYSLKNSRVNFPTEKTRVYFAGVDSIFEGNSLTSGLGIEFDVGPDFISDVDALGCLNQALNDWICETGVRWSTTQNSNPSVLGSVKNSFSTISFGQIEPSNVLGQTVVRQVNCSGGGGTTISPAREIDIVISNRANHLWFKDSTGLQNQPAGQYDLYSVLLHEIGHAHLHKHVNQSDDLMYFEAKDLPLSYENRSIYLSSANVAGGLEAVNSSSTVDYSFCNVNDHPMQPFINLVNCGFGQSIAEKMLTEVQVYPNPGSGTINIHSHQEIDNIQVYNALGQLCDMEIVGNSAENIQLHLQQPKRGIYFLQVEVNGKRQSQKIIIQ